MEKELTAHKDFAEKSAEKRKILKVGNSSAITVPDHFLEWAGLGEGQEATIMIDVNKKGQRYIAFFKA